MNIHEFTGQYGCEIMGPRDNERVQALFNSLDMSSEKFSVITRKEPDYFRYLKYAAQKYFVIGFPNAKGALEGMVSLIIRPCYLNGRVRTVGHFFDLRFIRKRDRTITAGWKSLGDGFMRQGHEVEELDGCTLYQGAYIATNVYATRSIGEDKKVAPSSDKKENFSPPSQKQKGKVPFLISDLATYRAINLFARKPLKAMGSSSFNRSRRQIVVERGCEALREPVKAFLDKQHHEKAFGYVYANDHDELARRLRDWDGFSMSSFFIAMKSSGEIAGTFGVFNPIHGRQIYIDKIPREKALIAKMGKAVGMKIPQPNKKLEILYLTAFELKHGLTHEERLDVFDALLDALYKSGLPKSYHMVSLCDYERQSLIEVIDKGYIYDATPVRLYQLHAPHSSEVYREAELNHSPGHEMVLS